MICILILTVLTASCIIDVSCHGVQEFKLQSKMRPQDNNSPQIMNMMKSNITAFDLSENVRVLPKSFSNTNMRTIKKQKKRTIQKMLRNLKKKRTVQQPVQYQMKHHKKENAEKKQSQQVKTTTSAPVNQKRKKKFNNKLPRYKMPYSRLHRNKRSVNGNSDEIDVLTNDDIIKQNSHN